MLMEFTIFFLLQLNIGIINHFKVNKGFENSRFHQISTDEVYGSVLNGSFDENRPINLTHHIQHQKLI